MLKDPSNCEWYKEGIDVEVKSYSTEGVQKGLEVLIGLNPDTMIECT